MTGVVSENMIAIREQMDSENRASSQASKHLTWAVRWHVLWACGRGQAGCGARM